MAKPTVLPVWDINDTNTTAPDTAHEDDGWLAPGGVPEKPPFQYFNYLQKLYNDWLTEINIKGVLGYDALTDYVASLSYAVGSDGNLYQCLINNGPSSSVVNPVGDTTGTWVDTDKAKAASEDNSAAGPISVGSSTELVDLDLGTVSVGDKGVFYSEVGSIANPASGNIANLIVVKKSGTAVASFGGAATASAGVRGGTVGSVGWPELSLCAPIEITTAGTLVIKSVGGLGVTPLNMSDIRIHVQWNYKQ